jgi:mono/diheme cytochrome c family protein
MPAYGWKLDDNQVAAVATHVRNAWGDAAPAVSAAQVQSLKSRLTVVPQ